MKRCHQYEPSAAEGQRISPSIAAPKAEPGEVAETTKQTSRKRSAKDAESSTNTVKKQKTQGRKGRQASNTDTQESAIDGLEKQQKLHDEWRQRRLHLQEFVQRLQGPNDSPALDLIQTELTAMVAINQTMGP